MRKLLILVVLLVTAAACGDNTNDTGAVTATSPPAAQGGIQACQNRTIPTPAEETDTAQKPVVVVPDGAPPCTLVVQDIKIGTGATAAPGATVTVQYVGVTWSTKKQFDSTWDRGQPARLSLKTTLEGGREGIPGMKEGGRRRIIVPPAMGYGSVGREGVAPSETLVFVVDLIRAR